MPENDNPAAQIITALFRAVKEIKEVTKYLEGALRRVEGEIIVSPKRPPKPQDPRD